jgi:hypothetical protein
VDLDVALSYSSNAGNLRLSLADLAEEREGATIAGLEK